MVDEEMNQTVRVPESNRGKHNEIVEAQMNQTENQSNRRAATLEARPIASVGPVGQEENKK